MTAIRRCRLLILAALLGGLLAAPGLARAQVVVAPTYAGSYTVTSLGGAPTVPNPYGGLTFSSSNPNVLLIGGAADSSNAKIYAVNVVRGAQNHINGFSGTPTVFANANGSSGNAGIDGGLAFGPSTVLFYTSNPDNQLAQITSGSSGPDKFIALGPLGVTSSTGSLAIVPAGLPGAGQLKLTSFDGNTAYNATLTADFFGTFNLSNVQLRTTFPASTNPEGYNYVAGGNPLFSQASVLVNEFGLNRVSSYTVDANGDPVLASRQDFLTGFTSGSGTAPVGGAFDPPHGRSPHQRLQPW
jgi:hypothetical protein